MRPVRVLVTEVTASTVSTVVVTFFDRNPLFDVWEEDTAGAVDHRTYLACRTPLVVVVGVLDRIVACRDADRT